MLSSTRWIVVAGICLHVTGVALYLRDVYGPDNSGAGGPPIGTVTSSEQDVQRRPRTQLIWRELYNGNNVFERDSIKTGRGSFTRIDLGKAGVIELRDESLVVLEATQSGLTINVASGDLSIKGDMKARIGDTEIQGSGGSVSISKDGDSGELKVQSNSGNVKIVGEDGKVTELSAGSVLSKGQDGSAKIEQFPLTRSFPEDAALQRLRPDEALKFRLNVQGDAAIAALKDARPVLQIAKDKEFADILHKERVRDVTAPISLEMENEGIFYWRVWDDRNDKALSNTGSFETRLPPKLAWIEGNSREPAAAKSAESALQVLDNGLSANLEWAPVRDAQSYRLDFLDDSQLLHSEEKISGNKLVWFEQKNPLWQTLRGRKSGEKTQLQVRLEAFDDKGRSLAPPLVRKIAAFDDRAPAGVDSFVATLDQRNPLKSVIKWNHKGEGKDFELKNGEKIDKVRGDSLTLDTEHVFEALSGKREVALRAVSARGVPSNWQVLSGDAEAFTIPGLFATAPKPLYPLADSRVLYRSEGNMRFEFVPPGNERHQPVAYEIVIEGPSGNISKSFPASKRGELELPFPKPGHYTWKLRAEWDKLGKGPFSAPQELKVSLGAGSVKPPALRQPASVDY